MDSQSACYVFRNGSIGLLQFDRRAVQQGVTAQAINPEAVTATPCADSDGCWVILRMPKD